MKATTSLLNLKRLAVVTFALFVFASFAQSNPGISENDALNSARRLEQFMVSAEKSIRFIAPPVQDSYRDTGKTENKTDENPQSGITGKVAEDKVFLVESSEQRNIWTKNFHRNSPSPIQIGYYQKVKTTFWTRIRKSISRDPEKLNGRCKIIATAYIM